MRRSRAHLVGRLVASVVLAVILAVPMPAFAALEDDPKAESSTNPNMVSGQETWWRDGWGKTLLPDILFTNIPKDSAEGGESIETLGFYYWMTRGSVPDTQTLPALNVSIDTSGTMHGQVFDLRAMYDDPSMGLGPPASLEGTYTVWVGFYNRFRMSSLLYGYFLGYDATRPGGISGLKAATVINGPQVDAWTESGRRTLTWNHAFDNLSGIGVYRYKLNGQFAGYEPGQLPPIYPGGPSPAPQITFESLPPGKNKIQITPIDRATNEGPTTTVYAYVDPDVPKIDITAPEGDVINAKPTFKTTATDKAGIRSVKFYVNDDLVYTDTTKPYRVLTSLADYAQGSWIKVKAVVQDMYGHTATDTRTYKLDKVAPKLSAIGDSPDPFYPVLQDDYKDKASVSFNLSEKATVYLYVYEGSKLIREIRAPRGKGACTIKWDGKNADGEVKTGKFYYKLSAVDAAGNKTTTSKYSTTIRDYEIIRIDDDAVKVVPR